MAATSTTPNSGVSNDSALIVGIFNSGDDAHRSLSELRGSGFSSSQIGAAFRDNPSRSASGAINPSTYSTGRAAMESVAGASDPSLNTANVATGTADYDPSTYPHQTSDRLNADADYPVTGTSSRQTSTSHAGESWWERLKHVFTDSDPADTRADREVSSASGYSNDYDFGYESNEFEGTLTQAGVAPDRARYLSRELPSGGAIVTVRAAERSDEAQRIIEQNNGRVRFENDTAARLEPEVRGDSAYDQAQPARTGSQYADAGNVRGSDRIQLFGEVLRVHKDRISRGEVVVRKEVVTENQSIEVPVTREEFVLERIPVDGSREAPGATVGSGQEVRIPLSEERVSVEKHPVVREEVRVGKREVTGNQEVGDQVRHEELRVDDESANNRDDPSYRKTA